MHPIELKRKLVDYTLAHAGDEERHYLGMSGIAKCPRHLYNEMVHGRGEASYQLKMYSYLGYLFERDILERLAGIDAGLLGPSEEFSLWDGQYQGHSDAAWDSDLLEIKSTVANRIAVVKKQGIPPHYYWQVQAYMNAGGYEHSNVIFVARDTGEIYVVDVDRNRQFGNKIMNKAERILEGVNHNRPPKCECGRCK